MEKRSKGPYPFWPALMVICAAILLAAPAHAFTRGLASKVRAMQANAYNQRLTNAQQAFAAGNYEKSAQEAQLALQHASTPDKARPVHELLAAAYQKLKNSEAAAPHLAWLKDQTQA